MKTKLLLVGLTLLSAQIFAQEMQTKKCATVEHMHYLESKNPGYIQATKSAFTTAKNNISAKSDDVYTIPVVVHIVYSNPTQNLHDSVIFNQIQILNEDYNRENGDTVNMRSAFLPHVGKGNIRFQLASVDPSGNPTTGITRTETTTESFMDIMGFFVGDMSSLEKVKSTADGGINPWNQSKYLNIWVCNMAIIMGQNEIPMLMGYATPPANLPNWPTGSVDNLSDGVVVQYSAFGSNNPVGISGYEIKGRTATHEVGHYLGLRHVWGDGDCSQDDGIADTPNAADQSQQDCDPSKNTCVDNIGGVDLPDMIENFMDYSAEDCQNSFTQEQFELMRGVLETNRWDLIHNNPAVSIQQATINLASLYPNPSNSMITLSTEKPILGMVVVTDLNGKEVLQQAANGTNTVISIEQLEKGIYQLSYMYNGTKSMMKLVKI